MTAPCTSITDERLDDLLEEIFIRLPTSADLVRTSIAFHQLDTVHQLVTDRSFLRRFRKEHPIFIGFFNCRGFHRVLLPHTSAPIANVVAHDAVFTFSFLPHPNCRLSTSLGSWIVKSIHDGRVLLSRGHKYAGYLVVFPELVVCDPLHRKYRLLPAIPNDLAAMVKDPLEITRRCCYEVVQLCPGKEVGEENKEYEISFRVMWMGQCRTKVVAFVYSSSSGQWQAIASKSWSDFLGCVPMPTLSLESSLFGRRFYAHGCLYWLMLGTERGLKDYPREVMLVLDTMTMEFSVADLPPGRSWRGRDIAIVEAGEGRLGLITSSNVISELHLTFRQSTYGSSYEWLLEKITPLDTGFGYKILIAANERYMLLWKYNNSMNYNDGFSLDVKTFQLERVCEIHHAQSSLIYTSFPPSLASTKV